jgi:hypothetical protein
VKQKEALEMTRQLTSHKKEGREEGEGGGEREGEGERGEYISVIVNGRGGCGGHLWDAAQHLVCWLDQSSHPLALSLSLNPPPSSSPSSSPYCSLSPSLRVLDIGSGTGLCGIYTCMRGAYTVLSDLHVMMKVMQANMDGNGFTGTVVYEGEREKGEGEGRERREGEREKEEWEVRGDEVSALVLEWGNDGTRDFLRRLCTLSAFSSLSKWPPFDLILVSDCVYLEGAFQPLIETLLILTERTNPFEKSAVSSTLSSFPAIVMAYQKRRKAEKRFFGTLKKHFDIEKLPKEELKEIRMRTSKVQLFLITRKNSSPPLSL